MKEHKRPLILITNDDSIKAPGIRMLIKIMSDLGDVVVVAPDSPQSGMGHAVTLSNPLFIKERPAHDGAKQEFSCSGTPADCVKIAKHEILHRQPDLCVSGINHGSNASVNVIYSGTMSAAIEAGMAGIPAIGFSLLNHTWEADFSKAQLYIKQIAKSVLEKGLPEGVVLNVNIPDLDSSEIKGIRVCRQARAYWHEKFDRRTSPFGQVYYWLTGYFNNQDHQTDTDIWALENGYISVVPVQFDLTSHQTIHTLKHLE